VIEVKHATLICLLLLLNACSGAPDNQRMVGETASDRIVLTAEFAEPIIEIAVVEGEPVRKGSLLLRQDTARAEAHVAEAAALLDQARARLAELVSGPRREKIEAARASLEGAEQQLRLRTAELERVRSVHARNLISEERLDLAQANLDAAQASAAVATAELDEMLAGTRLEELMQAEAAVEQARARNENARIDLSRHTIRAPADGLIDTRLLEPGERPTAGQAVMIMLSGKQSYARVYVTEHLRAQVQPGDTATVLVDGIDKSLRGRVRWVSSDAAFTPYYALTEHDRGRLSYEAKIDFVDDIRRVPDGVPLEVQLGESVRRE
jgi:HlyD family secretion protein